MALLADTVLAQDEKAIETILVSKGLVQAVSADGESRELRRRSDIFVEVTIVSSPESFAQIRLIDSAIIALKENSEFQFNEYS